MAERLAEMIVSAVPWPGILAMYPPRADPAVGRPASCPEELQDRIGARIGDLQCLDAELFLGLQGLEAG